MNDYISREAALNLIECNDKVCHYADERYENVVYATTQTICKVVAEMPAADAPSVDRWISVEDSLPPDNKPCAVVTKNNGLGVSRLMGRNKVEWTLFGEPVLYWIPLPIPPKDGDTNG